MDKSSRPSIAEVIAMAKSNLPPMAKSNLPNYKTKGGWILPDKRPRATRRMSLREKEQNEKKNLMLLGEACQMLFEKLKCDELLSGELKKWWEDNIDDYTEEQKEMEAKAELVRKKQEVLDKLTPEDRKILGLEK